MRHLTRPQEPVQATAVQARDPAGRAADSGGPTVPADRTAGIRNIISKAAIWTTSSEIFSGISSIMEAEAAAQAAHREAARTGEPAVLEAVLAEAASAGAVSRRKAATSMQM